MDTQEPLYSRESYAGGGGLRWIALLLALSIPLAVLMSTYDRNADDAMKIWIGEIGDTGRAVRPMLSVEALWAIEDARVESETPLVDAMFNGQSVLGYDRESNTFYCTIGMNHGVGWPKVKLSARGIGEETLRVAWIDDYTFDACEDAIRNGYRYELIAYTDKVYSYVGVVFTGLPLVTINAQEEIGWGEDVYGEVHISSAEYEPIHSMAQLHLRGGGFYLDMGKQSYHMELRTHAFSKHEHKRSASLLGMEADTDWLLLANNRDETCINNEVAWSMWRDWVGENGLTALQSRFVEVFEGDEYKGIYQLIQRIDSEKELLKIGGNLDTDIVGRKIVLENQGWRPRRSLGGKKLEPELELRYAPQSMDEDHAFDVLMDFIALEGAWDEGQEHGEPLSDEAFAEAAARSFDMNELMSHFLFIQACGLTDNVLNNVYIWALRAKDGHYVYRLSPWDMDTAFAVQLPLPDGYEDQLNLQMTGIVRMLDLNVAGCRRILWDLWREKRATILKDDAYERRISQTQELLYASGAYPREIAKWDYTDDMTSITSKLGFVRTHMQTIEEWMLELWPEE